jgi:hypothetical protein
VYSPQIHEEIARHRQADMRREARRERLAAMAATNGPGKLARLGGVLASVAKRRRLVARRELASGSISAARTGVRPIAAG